MSQPDSPIFFLEWIQQSACFVGMLLGIFPHAHLVIQESIRPALHHFENGRRLLLKREDFGTFDTRARPDLAARALAHGKGFSSLIEILL